MISVQKLKDPKPLAKNLVNKMFTFYKSSKMCGAYVCLNPNSIGVKYPLIVWEGGGAIWTMSFFTSLLVKSITKAVSNRDIGFIKAMLLLCEHFSLKFATHKLII